MLARRLDVRSQILVGAARGSSAPRNLSNTLIQSATWRLPASAPTILSQRVLQPSRQRDPWHLPTVPLAGLSPRAALLAPQFAELAPLSYAQAQDCTPSHG